MSRSLYEIDSELALIISQLESEDFSEEEKQKMIDVWFESCQDEVEAKIDGYCSVIADRDAWANVRKAEAEKLANMAKADEATVKRLKSAAVKFFERAGIDKMKTAHFNPRVQKNGGKVPLIIDEEIQQNPKLLPVECWKAVPTIDTDAVRSLLERSADVPGCRLGEVGSHFRIR